MHFLSAKRVEFNSFIQLSKGTWTEEDSDMEYFATKQPKEWWFSACFLAKYSLSQSSAVQVPLLNWTGESNPTVCKKKKRKKGLERVTSWGMVEHLSRIRGEL